MTLFGIDRLLIDPDLRKPLEGKRAALLAHPASVTRDLTHSLDALVASGLNVSAVFGPQHGVRGDLQDNMMESPDFTDPTYGVPVFSLYGATKKPTPAMLRNVDVLLFDIQDIGVRYYTYISTMGLAMQAAAAARIPFVVLGLGLISLVEGGIIAAMAMRPAAAPAASTVVIESPAAGDTVLVDGKPAGTTPLKLAVSSGTRAIRLIPAVVSTSIVSTPSVAAASDQAEKDRQALAAITAAAAQQRSGGVRINSPIELKVLEGDRVLGTTADGPIVTTAGTHQLDFMNSALGFRVHQAVTIRAGVLTAMTVTPPMGRLSINAEPWAQVTIDDKPIGDTPLANVAVTLGEHEVLFRHPQLGERRETVVVRADAPARVITSFQR